MIIVIPVKCQNGHKADWLVEIKEIGLDYYQWIPEEQKCHCPKHDLGEGYITAGEPYIIVDKHKIIISSDGESRELGKDEKPQWNVGGLKIKIEKINNPSLYKRF